MNIIDFFTSAPYLLIGSVGLAVLLIAAALDGLLEAFDFGDGPVSLMTVAGFLALFGFSAAGFEYLGFETPLVLAIAVGAGIVASILVWQLSRFLKNQSTSASHSTASIVGSEATVRLRIRAGGVGEIALRRNGHLHTYTAQADKDIAEGTPVIVVSVLSDTFVLVRPKDDPIEIVSGDFRGVSEEQIQEWADEAERGYDLKG